MNQVDIDRYLSLQPLPIVPPLLVPEPAKEQLTGQEQDTYGSTSDTIKEREEQGKEQANVNSNENSKQVNLTIENENGISTAEAFLGFASQNNDIHAEPKKINDGKEMQEDNTYDPDLMDAIKACVTASVCIT